MYNHNDIVLLGPSELEKKLKRGLNPNFITGNWSSFLYDCVVKDTNFDRVRLLLRYGVDPNRPNIDGGGHQFTRAIGVAIHNGSLDLLQLLLDNRVNPNLCCRMEPSWACPLDLCNDPKQLFLLLRYGAIDCRYDKQMINQVFIIIDIMLYSSIQKDWSIEIKSYLY